MHAPPVLVILPKTTRARCAPPGWQGPALAPSGGSVTRRRYHCRGQPGSVHGKPAVVGRQNPAGAPRPFAAPSLRSGVKNARPKSKNRKFESISLHRRVCKLSVPLACHECSAGVPLGRLLMRFAEGEAHEDVGILARCHKLTVPLSVAPEERNDSRLVRPRWRDIVRCIPRTVSLAEQDRHAAPVATRPDKCDVAPAIPIEVARHGNDSLLVSPRRRDIVCGIPRPIPIAEQDWHAVPVAAGPDKCDVGFAVKVIVRRDSDGSRLVCPRRRDIVCSTPRAIAVAEQHRHAVPVATGPDKRDVGLAIMIVVPSYSFDPRLTGP